MIDAALGDRLVRAAGFRNAVAHAYESLDMVRVHRAATDGPRDLNQRVGQIQERDYDAMRCEMFFGGAAAVVAAALVRGLSSSRVLTGDIPF